MRKTVVSLNREYLPASSTLSMPTIAYLTNLFPAAVEPYVGHEIQELRRRGVTVVPCSARRGDLDAVKKLSAETICIQPLRLRLALRALFVCLQELPQLKDLFARILFQGHETLRRRFCALLHTWLGAYYALLLEDKSVEHIHVHHGYFASWIAMVAARILGINFSMTLHGSDLLLHAAYLDTKLENCSACVTVSEFNRQHILHRYPNISEDKIVVQRLGVDPYKHSFAPPLSGANHRLVMVAVGRLHRVKDHVFLIRACRLLKNEQVPFLCLIAGEGPERKSLERLIRELNLSDEMKLTGHLPQPDLDALYARADVVVLTSRSEGIPLVLMEAMARGKPVLAPAITGIPELVLDGKTGFLYRPGSLEDFVAHVELVHQSLSALSPLRRAARKHVQEHFNSKKNLAAFCDFFLDHLRQLDQRQSYENPVLQ